MGDSTEPGISTSKHRSHQNPKSNVGKQYAWSQKFRDSWKIEYREYKI